MKSINWRGWMSCVFFFFGVLAVFGTGNATEGKTVQPFDDSISITLKGQNRTLGEMLPEIADQSGYTIEIVESLLTQKIGGVFVATPVTDFFERIFKEKNVFQIVDPTAKTIKIFVSDRGNERVLIVHADAGAGSMTGTTSTYWLESSLDGEPGRTNKDLLDLREENVETDNPNRYELDGEPGKSMQDLLDERKKINEQYDTDTIALDGEPDRTGRDLLHDREEAAGRYDAAQVVLDGESGKTTQDLLDERAEQADRPNTNLLPLDGEPGRTFQDLLDEREQVMRERME